MATNPAVPVLVDPADVAVPAAHSADRAVVADEPELAAGLVAAVAVDAAAVVPVADAEHRTHETRLGAVLSTDSSRTSATGGDLNNRL